MSAVHDLLLRRIKKAPDKYVFTSIRFSKLIQTLSWEEDLIIISAAISQVREIVIFDPQFSSENIFEVSTLKVPLI
jgi:hypothetical protein